MSINLYDILQTVLNESNNGVSPSEINDAINNKYGVIIKYDDEKKPPHKGDRFIEPCVYFLNKANHEAIGAFEY